MGYANYLKDYLLVEGYYFSYFYDLSLSRAAFAEGYPLKKKFVWNMFISKNLARLNEVNWFVGLMQGFVKQVKLTL